MLASVALVAAGLNGPPPPAPQDDRPNIIVILTDDQSFDTLPSHPAAMPWLQDQIHDPTGSWLWFPNAFISTPICCPSRATILSGRYSHHTNVRTNDDGERFDDSDTLATWLHNSGYFTGLVGKYLNRYPFGRAPYVPAGWDRWVAKRNTATTTTYFDFGFVDRTIPLTTAHGAGTYATDLFADRAVDFIRVAPAEQPYFLYFATSAPHPPWTPPPRHAGAFAGVPISVPPSVNERNVSDKPAWVQALDPLDGDDLSRLMSERRRERATLLGVDDAIRRIVGAAEARGDLDRTIIFFLTDNGFSFGEHRIRGKRCQYEECIRTPFAVLVPGGESGQVNGLISNVDLAPTIVDLAGIQTAPLVDGRSFRRALAGRPWKGPPGVLLEWAGDDEVPAWQGVRTRDFAYVESADGTVELYDLTGALGRADPFEVKSRSDDPRYRVVVDRLAALLRRLRSRELHRS